MGSEDLFHKRKAKAAPQLGRRKPVRASYDKVLIVCEGEKTEPLYFNELVDYYEIYSANVMVIGDCGSDPLSVVNHGIKLYGDESLVESGTFDKVYCVFDRDTHPNYQQALDKLAGVKPKAVSSQPTPCHVSNIGYCCILLIPRHPIHLSAE